jgi:hypothetical protein
MGWKWEVQLYCVKDMVDGSEDWGWETVYTGQSMFQALRAAHRAKKETDGAVKVIWR